MRSSIFNSKSPALLYVKALMGVCGILLLVFEISANYYRNHRKEAYTRLSRQYAEAVKARPSRLGEPPSVLMVGNSLLNSGIQVDRLQELTSGRMRIYPVFFVATGYYDWLYGLERLFRRDARPQVVVVGVGVIGLFLNGVRQDYAPMLLFDAQDILDVASDLKMDRTATSNLLLAHWSVFCDERNIIRTYIVRRIVPHSEELRSLVDSIVKAKATIPAGPEFEAITVARIQSLRRLCEENGAKLIILLPPMPFSEHAVRRMAVASQKVGVASLVPIDPATLSERFYQPDAIHLNSEGATLFTSALATFLPLKIAELETAFSPSGASSGSF